MRRQISAVKAMWLWQRLACLVVEPVTHAVEVNRFDGVVRQRDSFRKDVRAVGLPEETSVAREARDRDFAVRDQGVMVGREVKAEAGCVIDFELPVNLERLRREANNLATDGQKNGFADRQRGVLVDAAAAVVAKHSQRLVVQQYPVRCVPMCFPQRDCVRVSARVVRGVECVGRFADDFDDPCRGGQLSPIIFH